MKRNGLPYLSISEKVFSFSEKPDKISKTTQFSQDFMTISASIELGSNLMAPGNICLNSDDYNATKQMIDSRQIEKGVKEKASRFLKMVDEVKQTQNTIDLTASLKKEKVKNCRFGSHNKPEVVESRYITKEQEPISIQIHYSKTRSRSKSAKRQNLTTIFQKIKLENNKIMKEKSSEFKQCKNSRFVISKRQKLKKEQNASLCEPKKSRNSSLSVKSRNKISVKKENLLEDLLEEKKQGQGKKGKFLRQTLKNTDLFAKMLSLVENDS